jgi:hypothetical protein
MSLRRDLKRGRLGVRTWVNLTFIMATVILALAGHLAEIVLWAFSSTPPARSPTSARRFIHPPAATRLRAPTSHCRPNGGCSDRLKRWTEC